MGAGHGHAHGPESARLRRLLLLVLAPFALATLIGLVVLWPDERPAAREGLGVADETVKATVTERRVIPCTPDLAPEPEDPSARPPECVETSLRLTSGDDEGETVRMRTVTGDSPITLRRGSKVVLAVEADAEPEFRYRVLDMQRGRPLLLLGLLFVAAVVALGRWRGLASLAGLALSLLVLVKFVLPAVLAGANPLPIAVVGSAAIMFVAVFLAHGFGARSSVAVLGTLLSLLLTGVLAGAVVAAGEFTGLATEEATFIRAVYGQVDVHGLLLAGVIIGSLGVLDDVTVTQASAVWELRAADPSASQRSLFTRGLRIGRDHIASTVNTLVLAYAGASLPLLLLFTVAGRPLVDVLTSEVIAQEVVRTLVGSVGLVASVPITTALAAFVAVREPALSRDDHDEWADSFIEDLRDAKRTAREPGT